MEVKNSVWVKRNQPISHGACRFVFSDCFRHNFPSLSMFQHQLSLVADFPFGLNSVKLVYACLKAFQVRVHDTGNSQVKGEQLHKCSVGTKANFLFVRVLVTVGASCICQRIYESVVNNWIYILWSSVVNMIQKNIFRFLLLTCFRVSATRCYVALWQQVIF